MIVGYLRDRQLEVALNKLEEMQKEQMPIQPWLLDLFVYTFCDTGDFDEVLQIIRYRVGSIEGSISGTLWCYVLDAASRARHHGATVYAWHKRVETEYLNPASGVCINVLNTAARHADVGLATDVLRILGNRKEALQTHHYEALMEAYIEASDLKAAFTILTIMASSSDIPPTESSTRPIYHLLVQNPPLHAQAMSVLKSLKNAKRNIPIVALNCIIEALIHHRDLATAIETYKVLHTFCPGGPTTTTFNFLFRGCVMDGRKDLAMFLASEMLALKVPPDLMTYDRLILVCLNRAGGDDLGDAFRYFAEMKDMGSWPREGTLVAMVKRCCEVGSDRVWSLVEEMEARGMNVVLIQRWVGENWSRYAKTRQAAKANGGIEPGKPRAKMTVTSG